jgi:hypothetical protein
MNSQFWLSIAASRSVESGRLLADLARFASCVVVGAALCWHSIDAPAKERTLTIAAPEARLTKVRLAELEKTFWLCDHAATRHGVDPELGQLCFNATEELRQEKFGGDGEKMLAWWQRNKEAQHQKLDQSEGLR